MPPSKPSSYPKIAGKSVISKPSNVAQTNRGAPITNCSTTRPKVSIGGPTSSGRNNFNSKGLSFGGSISTKKKIVILISVVIAIGLAVGLYFGLKAGNSKVDEAVIEAKVQKGHTKLKELALKRLGYSFDISKMKLLEEDLVGGFKIFADIVYDENEITDSKFSMNYFESDSQMKEYVANSFGLGGSYKALGGTFDSLSSTTKSNTKQSSSLLMDNVELLSSYSLVAHDIENFILHPTFLKDFAALPGKPVENPHLTSSWTPFEKFTQKYGTHVVTQVDMGARVQYWQFTSSTSTDSKKAMETKLCLSLEGTSLFSVGGCMGHTEEDYQAAKNSEITQKTFVSGGTPAKKAQMKANPQVIDSLFNGDPNDAAPIGFKFKPLAFFIDSYVKKHSSDGPENSMRQFNLNSYFKLLSKKCDLIPGTELSYKFLDYVDGQKAYVCKKLNEGCQSNEDCHRDSNLLGTCYLYGPTAFLWENEKPKFISGNINQRWPACVRPPAGTYCDCLQKPKYTNLWSTNETD